MQWVLLTALGVGMATVLGAALGFLTGALPHRFNDMILGFAAGVMLCAAVLGLIVPAVEQGGRFGGLVAVAGVGLGALTLSMLDRFTPHLHKLAGVEKEELQHGLLLFGLTEDGQKRAGTVFLHINGSGVNIRGACRQEHLCGKADLLRGHVI